MKTNYGEFRVLSIRETLPQYIADTPSRMANYWHNGIALSSSFDPDKETMVVVLLNTRLRIIGHAVVSVGLVDTVHVHPREVFRPAIVGAAKAVCLMHNHPSGDASPSEADIRVTRQIAEAGKILQIEVTDHVVVGQKTDENRGYTSLRELGLIGGGR
jgi:DNA repair protein RadC